MTQQHRGSAGVAERGRARPGGAARGIAEVTPHGAAGCHGPGPARPPTNHARAACNHSHNMLIGCGPRGRGAVESVKCVTRLTRRGGRGEPRGGAAGRVPHRDATHLHFTSHRAPPPRLLFSSSPRGDKMPQVGGVRVRRPSPAQPSPALARHGRAACPPRAGLLTLVFRPDQDRPAGGT